MQTDSTTVSELVKLLASRRDALVAVIGAREAVSKYIGETEKQLANGFDDADRAGPVLFVDEAEDLFGRQAEIEDHDGPVVLGVRDIRSIPEELREGLVVVRAPRGGLWRRGS